MINRDGGVSCLGGAHCIVGLRVELASLPQLALHGGQLL